MEEPDYKKLYFELRRKVHVWICADIEWRTPMPSTEKNPNGTPAPSNHGMLGWLMHAAAEAELRAEAMRGVPGKDAALIRKRGRCHLQEAGLALRYRVKDLKERGCGYIGCFDDPNAKNKLAAIRLLIRRPEKWDANTPDPDPPKLPSKRKQLKLRHQQHLKAVAPGVPNPPAPPEPSGQSASTNRNDPNSQKRRRKKSRTLRRSRPLKGGGLI